MTVIFTRAHVPTELQREWLQHLRNFDTLHPGCHFEVMIDGAPDVPITEAVRMCRVDPELTFQQIFDRKK